MTGLVENMAAAEAVVSFHHALNITQKEKDKNLLVFHNEIQKILISRTLINN